MPPDLDNVKTGLDLLRKPRVEEGLSLLRKPGIVEVQNIPSGGSSSSLTVPDRPFINETQRAEKLAAAIERMTQTSADQFSFDEVVEFGRANPKKIKGKDLNTVRRLMAEERLFPKKFAKKFFAQNPLLRLGRRIYLTGPKTGFATLVELWARTHPASLSIPAIKEGTLAFAASIDESVEREIRQTTVGPATAIGDVVGPFLDPLLLASFTVGPAGSAARTAAAGLKPIAGKVVTALTRRGLKPKTAEEIGRLLVDMGRESARAGVALGEFGAAEKFAETGRLDRAAQAGIIHAISGVAIGPAFGAAGFLLKSLFARAKIEPMSPKAARKRLELPKPPKPVAPAKLAEAGLKQLDRAKTGKQQLEAIQAVRTLAETLKPPVEPAVPPRALEAHRRPPTAPEAKPKDVGPPAAGGPKLPRKPAVRKTPIQARIERVTGQKDISPKVVTTQKQALKAKLREQRKGGRLAAIEAAQKARVRIVNIQKAHRVVQDISEGLRRSVQRIIQESFPVAERGTKALLDQVRITKDIKTFRKALRIISNRLKIRHRRLAVVDFNIALAQLKRFGKDPQTGRTGTGGLRALQDVPGEQQLLRTVLKELEAEEATTFLLKDDFTGFKQSLRRAGFAFKRNLAGEPRTLRSTQDFVNMAAAFRQAAANRRARDAVRIGKTKTTIAKLVKRYMGSPKRKRPSAGKGRFGGRIRTALKDAGAPSPGAGVALALRNSRNIAKQRDGEEVGVFFALSNAVDTGIKGAERWFRDDSLLFRKVVEKVGIKWGSDEMARMGFHLSGPLNRLSGEVPFEAQIGSVRKALKVDTTGIVGIVDTKGRLVRFTPAERMEIAAIAQNAERRRVLTSGKTHELGRRSTVKFRLTERQVVEIESSLSFKERAIVVGFLKILSRPNRIARLVEVGLDLFGMRFKTLKKYWPTLAVAEKDLFAVEGDIASMIKSMAKSLGLEGQPFLKARRGGRGLVINDIFQTFQSHSMRSGLFMEGARANRSFRQFIDNPRIRDEILEEFGGRQELAFWRLYLDTAAGELSRVPTDMFDALARGLQGSGTKAILGNNPFVFIKQMFSGFLATADMMVRERVSFRDLDLAKFVTASVRGYKRAPRNVLDQFTDNRRVRDIPDKDFQEMIADSPRMWVRYNSSAVRLSTPVYGRDIGFYGRRSIFESGLDGLKLKDRVTLLYIRQTYLNFLKRTKPEQTRMEARTEAARRLEDQVAETQPDFSIASQSGFALGARINPYKKLLIPFTTFLNKAFNWMDLTLARARWAKRDGNPKLAAKLLASMLLAIALNNSGAHIVNEVRRWFNRGFRPRLTPKSIGTHFLDVVMLTLGFVYQLDRAAAVFRDKLSDSPFISPVAEGQTIPERMIVNLFSAMGNFMKAIIEVIENDKFDSGTKSGLLKASDTALDGVDRLVEGSAVVLGAPTPTPFRMGKGLFQLFWPTKPAPSYVQNQAYLVSGAARPDRPLAANVEGVRRLLASGVTRAELRQALRAETIERVTVKGPARTAAVRRALTSDTFKARRQRLESILSQL